MTEFVLVARFDRPINKQKMSRIVAKEFNVRPKMFFPKKNVMVTLIKTKPYKGVPFKKLLKETRDLCEDVLETYKITLIAV